MLDIKREALTYKNRVGGFSAVIGPRRCQFNLPTAGAVNLGTPGGDTVTDVLDYIYIYIYSSGRCFKTLNVKMCHISARLQRLFHLSLLVVLPLLTSALNQTVQVMKTVSRREAPTLPPPYLHLPVFVESRLPLVRKEHFSPARGTGLEPLPEPVRMILLPLRRPSTTTTTTPPSASGDSVRTYCELNKMHVQVSKSILGSGDAQSQLRLGTCRASRTTRHYLYFQYDIDMCGTKRQVII